jgi:site-specific DNA-cytosine methylase
MKKHTGSLRLVYPPNGKSDAVDRSRLPLSTIDLFCGAGGITEGFRQAGFRCLYANDCMPEAIQTFEENHPGVWADCENIERVKPAGIRMRLKIAKGDLDVRFLVRLEG